MSDTPETPLPDTKLKEMKLQDLKAKSPVEMQSFAEEHGVDNASTLRKQELMFAVLKQLAIKEVEITGMQMGPTGAVHGGLPQGVTRLQRMDSPHVRCGQRHRGRTMVPIGTGTFGRAGALGPLHFALGGVGSGRRT